jgi:hypothetical protein
MQGKKTQMGIKIENQCSAAIATINLECQLFCLKKELRVSTYKYSAPSENWYNTDSFGEDQRWWSMFLIRETFYELYKLTNDMGALFVLKSNLLENPKSDYNLIEKQADYAIGRIR